ncbi:MAG: copper-translocating P-type ATPase [Acidobacteriota bacterium]|nr:copper-translocating P-type ATPase [Acidobacteriota bacterium]MDH3785154.1 copper-translocating P-type ATPase [Acidobacteriota bacterium]
MRQPSLFDKPADPDPGPDPGSEPEVPVKESHCCGGARVAFTAPAGSWVCPMHPKVIESGPGACPDCGMDLEPASPLPDEATERQQRKEWHGILRRLGLCVLLTLPLLILNMGVMIGLLPSSWALPPWVQWLVATPVVLWGGQPFWVRGIDSIRNRKANMFTLILLGTGASYLYSFVALFAGRDALGAPLPIFFESAAVIVTLVWLGQALEFRSRARTGDAIRALLSRVPDRVFRVGEQDTVEEIDVGRVVVGDRLRIRAGDRVATDGVVVDGKSHVDESMVTGEPMPVWKESGATLTGGTLNGEGLLLMEATRVGADTLLSRIASLVAEAQRSQAPVQRLADRVAAWFVPGVLGVALLTAIYWGFVATGGSLGFALQTAVAVMVVACPCAIGLATPMAIMVGMGRGGREGVLLRSADALQKLSVVDTVVFDKTGTLTAGRPTVNGVSISAEGLKDFDELDLLRRVASVERYSGHPLAAAIVREAEERGLSMMSVSGLTEEPGRGIVGSVEGRRFRIGQSRWLEEHGVDTTALGETADVLRQQGQTTTLVAVDDRVVGLISLDDPIRESSAEALGELRRLGLKLLMLTGDDRVTAERVGARLGLDWIEAEVLPERKHQVVARLQDQGHAVAMAGDGINDAAALARADVGIALGTGSDAAIESAAVTLVHGDLRGILRARRLSTAVMGSIRQNLFLAFIYNVVAIPIAAGVLYPSLGLLVSPMIAAAAMSLSSVSVIANALRLQRQRL